jgi:hypothetical protein
MHGTTNLKCDKISIWGRVFIIEPAKTSSAQFSAGEYAFCCVWHNTQTGPANTPTPHC